MELAHAGIVVSAGRSFSHIVASHFAQTVNSYEASLKLANALIYAAEQAYTVRDLDALRDVSSVLMSLPIAAARQIGLYYHALALKRGGHIDEAQPLLETVAENAPITYRARALQSLGTNHHTKCQLDEALKLQLEALRVASDKDARGFQTTLLAHLEISHLLSDIGDHKGALRVLENTSPLVHIVSRQNPLYFYFYHNELAVEFGELGRVPEAEVASAVALTLPFATAYPEWTETRDAIAAKRQSATSSVVAFNRTPKASPVEQPEPETQPVPVCSTSRHRFGFKKDAVQRAMVPTAASIAIVFIGIIENILEWICNRNGPRAPPRLS